MRTIGKKLIFLLCYIFNTNYLVGQESWVCYDANFNAQFISAYVDALFDSNPDVTEGEIPQETDTLLIIISNENGESVISIESTGQTGDRVFNSEIVKRLDQAMILMLKKRKYDWDHIDFKKFAVKGRTAYKEADYKIIRDHNWWARNVLKMNPFTFNNKFILRPGAGSWSLMFKQGYEEIGYPATLSRNARVFISTEPTQIFLNLPWNPRNISYNLDVHPLESAVGGGLAFNVDNVGGMVSYQTLEDLEYADAFDPNNIIFNDWSGSLYWTRSFKISPLIPGDTSKDHELRKPLIPPGTQKIIFGVNYAKLTYGALDSISGFTVLESTDFGSSFSVFFNWQYLSEKIDPKDSGSYNFYHKWTGYFQANIGEGLRSGVGLLYSFSGGFAAGIDLAWVEPVSFLKGQPGEYNWNPGFVISPNITFRW